MTCALPQLKKGELSLKTATRHGRYLVLRLVFSAWKFWQRWPAIANTNAATAANPRGISKQKKDDKVRILQTVADSL